jgi:hypothetical protein
MSWWWVIFSCKKARSRRWKGPRNIGGNSKPIDHHPPHRAPLNEITMGRRSFIAELFDFILSNKAYFIAPIIIVLLLVGALIILGGTKAAPFIYTLF